MSAVVRLVEKAADAVGSAVSNVVEAAVNDPIGTIAKVAAVATGQFELLPVISAVDVVANGGNLEDAAKAAAISYIAPQVGAQIGTAFEYGTDPFSAQTTQLAAQSADMLSLPASLASRAASSATAAALGGSDIQQSMINTLANYGLRQGVDYTFDAVGNAINNNGDTLLSPSGELSPAVTTPISEQAQTDTNIINNGDGTYTMPNPEGGSVTTDAAGNVISSTTAEDQAAVFPQGAESLVTPIGEDQTTVESIAPETTVTPVTSDQTTVEPIAPTSVTTPAAGEQEYEPLLFAETPEEVSGFKWDPTTGTYVPEDAGTVDTSMSGYVIDPATGLPVAEGTPTSPSAPQINTSRLNKYLSNMFTSSLANQLLNRSKSVSRPFQKFTATGTSTPLSGASSEYGSPLFALSRRPVEMIGGEPSSGELMDLTKGAVWGTPQKISGLGFAGQYVNPQQSGAEDPSQQSLEEIKQAYASKGWLTTEEQLRLQELTGTSELPEEPIQAAQGGHIDHHPEFYSEGGASIAHRYVKGDGDGTSDSVPAMLASGEFVIPADVVSSLGNGDNDAGANVLDQFMAAVRKHKRSAHPSKLPPDSKGPLAYLKEAKSKKKVRK